MTAQARPYASRRLHLVAGPGATLDGSPIGDLPSLACAAFLNTTHVGDDTVCLIGSSASERRAIELGLDTPDRISVPIGRTEFIRRAFRRFLSDRDRFDAVYLWSDELAALPSAGASDAEVHRPKLDDVLTEGFAPSFDRAGARTTLGLDPDQPVALLFADPPVRGDAHRFGFVLSLLNSAGWDVTGICPASASGLARMLRVRRDWSRSPKCVVSDHPLPLLLAACDVVVRTSPAPCERALAVLADRAGIPMVPPPDATRESGAFSPPALAADIRPHLRSSPHALASAAPAPTIDV